jgi:predicted O-methyltransferase YrrM
MQQLTMLIRYINYLQQARNRFDIHPPFLYELITEVFDDRKDYPEYHLVEGLKDELLKRVDAVEVQDLGAGSTVTRKKVRTVADITRHSSKGRKHGRLLFRLSRHLKPGYILELGTAMGISSAYLALGNDQSEVTTIEGCTNIAARARENLKKIELERVTVINDDFDGALPRCLKQTDHVDLAFIDGNHREQPTLDYFEQILAKTVNASCIVFDDIHWSKGMERAWKRIINHPEVTLSIDLFHLGIVFFRKELSKQHFIIRF